MKKIFAWIALFVAVILFIEGKRSTRHQILRQETMLRHLKKEPFLTKEPAPWMLEQIEEDFLGVETISQDALDEAAETLSPMVVRYRIIDNELYRLFLEGEPISLDDNNTERAIKTITQRTTLPNMDFIISYNDAYPFGSPSKVPLFVSAKMKGEPNAILIPDWRSIGSWWMSEIKEVKKAACPWENKRSFALWRGGSTRALRHRLVKLSLENPKLLDARFSSYDPEKLKEAEAEGILGKRASWEEFCSCKYLPYVDGVMCAAPALQSRLLSGSLTLKPDSEEIQWFYRALKPYVHYVPVKSDLSNLIEQILWAQEHDTECRHIAEEACQFAKENLLYADVLNYFAFVLKRYGLCQKLDSKDMKGDPRWVNIQSRQKLRQLAEKNKFIGYCSEGTPLAI